jgi:hypothetical protein
MHTVNIDSLIFNKWIGTVNISTHFFIKNNALCTHLW